MSDKSRQAVVLDVMGADGGPRGIIFGGVEAARQAPDTLQVILVGHSEAIEPVLDSLPERPKNISVVHAPTEVPMDMAPTEGVRRRDSSISVGLQILKKKEAVAFVSPGNTGAIMACSLLTLGRISGVSRPALAGLFPTSTGKPCIVLDVGANADNKPQHLSQFAVMGSVYSEVLFNQENPRVGLVSIGEERSKGNELIFSTRKLLGDSKINFVGNIEGRDILSGAVDVAVTDGFTGNILLKFAESVKPLLVKAMKRQVKTNIFSRCGAMLMAPFLRRMRSTFDYTEKGGAPLLGIDGVVVVCHGSSVDIAMANAVLMAHGMAVKGINERIRQELITNHFGNNNEPKDKGQNLRDGIVCSAGGDDQC